MNSQRFDERTASKLITNYQKTISQYTSENKFLMSQLQDLKTTLLLNQNLLYDFIIKSVGNDEKINGLINESKTLWKENEDLMKQKNELEMKTAKLQELIEDTPTEIKEEIMQINKENDKMKVELLQKDNMIKKLKAELEKARRNTLFKTAKTEVLVTEPTKSNVEINHELLNTKAILSKVSAMHVREKKKANKLDKEVKNLQEEIIMLKSTAEKNDGLSREIKDAVDNLGYEEENDKIEDNDDDDEDEEEEEDGNIGKKPKNKQKELEMLTNQYNRLKRQNEEYENKLNKYKKIYKQMKDKIKNLNQISIGK